MRLFPTRRICAGLAGTGLVVATAVAATPAEAAPSTTLVVSEAYGGGGNSGATLKNDFIELQNVGAGDMDVSGYSVQYISAAPGATTTWGVTPLSGTAPAGGHFLVGEAAGAGGTEDLPMPDVSGGLNLSGTAGTVALVHSTTALTCKTAADCAADSNIVDLVGYGTAVIHEGAGDAPATTNTTSVQRAASGADTDNNAADFTAATPTPQGSGVAPPPPTTAIHDIQGASFFSPENGGSVSGVGGIVTAVNRTGFWMQDPTPDNDPATSEGIFVFTSTAPTVAAGDSVTVNAKVSEFDPGGSHTSTSNLTITELIGPAVTVVSSGNTLPDPVVLTPTTVPDTYAPDLGGASLDGQTIDRTRSALDFYESVEGMRVEVDDARVVGPSNSFGEQYVTTKPSSASTYRGGAELLGENMIPAGRLEVVPLQNPNLGVDVGDVLQGATIGPLDYSDFGGYVVAASTVGTVVHNHLPPITAQAGSSDQLSVATYNVENLAPGDPSAKFAALARGVITNLASPDVVALEEIQDNSGATDNGIVAADQTLKRLITRIIKLGGPHYKFREIDPVNDKDGGQPGGNIRNVFLYDPTRVSFVGTGSSKVNRSTTATQITTVDGHPSLTLSPGRIDPTNPVWTDSRKPLVGLFRFQGKDVFVIANHFDSKGGDQSADGRFQYPAQSSAVQRAGQAQVVHDFVQHLLAADAQAKAVVVGDLNDYQFSPSVAALRTGTADGSGPSILTDLITTLPIDEQYTYVYNGVSQVLDHILATSAVTAAAYRYQVVHVNSEYHDQVSDHDPQVVDITP